MSAQQTPPPGAIAVVGNINLDIKTTLIPATPSLFQDGETSVEEVYETVGGGGGNVALAAGGLGGQVHFCGCIGSDNLGARLEALLQSHGVTSHLSRKPGVTGRSINLIWDNHHRHFVSSLPNNRLLTAADINLPELAQAGCRHLFRADVWFAGEMLKEGNCEILRQARQLGMETSLDINWDPEWSKGPHSTTVQTRRAQLARVLPHLSWAHGNERELGFFTGCEDIGKSCHYLIDRGCGGVIVHQGARGAAFYSANEGWIEVPAKPAKSIESETGSGDVFSAAFLVFDSLPIRERLAKCCAIATEHLQGTIRLIPRLES